MTPGTRGTAYGWVLAVMRGTTQPITWDWSILCFGFEADRWDILGAAICLLGVFVLYFGPRGR